MTIAELIAELSKLPADWEATVWSAYDDDEAEIDRLDPNPAGHRILLWYGETLRERNGEQ